MPPTISFSFGDIVLVPFLFTDQTGSKQRPAVVVSSDDYHRQHADIILAGITSQPRGDRLGEVSVEHWQEAGLLRASVVKPALATVDRRLVIKRLGRLEDDDRRALRAALDRILGS